MRAATAAAATATTATAATAATAAATAATAAASATATSAVAAARQAGPGSLRTSARRRGLRRPGLLLVVLLLAVLGLAGCGGSDADGAATAEGAAADQGVAGAPAPDDAAGGGAGGEAGVGDEDAAGADAVLPGSGGTGRRVVTSTIDVAVDDVPAAAEQVRDLAVRVGGEVADESSQGGPSPRAEIVLRVPAGDTPGVLEEVARLGEEVARTADSEPVETRLVDLESRTATQRAGVERIRALLEQATTLEDVLALEAELTRRQADLESVDAQRAALADLASLATVTVRLTTPDDVEAPERELPPFLRGLDAGWEALGASTTVVLVVLGGLLPFAVVGGLLLGAVLLALRVRRSRRGATTPTGPRPTAQPQTSPAPAAQQQAMPAPAAQPHQPQAAAQPQAAQSPSDRPPAAPRPTGAGPTGR